MYEYYLITKNIYVCSVRYSSSSSPSDNLRLARRFQGNTVLTILSSKVLSFLNIPAVLFKILLAPNFQPEPSILSGSTEGSFGSKMSGSFVEVGGVVDDDDDGDGGGVESGGVESRGLLRRLFESCLGTNRIIT